VDDAFLRVVRARGCAQCVERSLFSGVVEVFEHPAEQAERELMRVFGVVAEPHGLVGAVDADIGAGGSMFRVSRRVRAIA
jgi:hypothetical protein